MIMGTVSKLQLIGYAALHSEEICHAYLEAQRRALDDVRDLPRDRHRINLFAERWLAYFFEEYGGDVSAPGRS